MAVCTRPPPAGPRAPGTGEGLEADQESAKSLPDGRSARPGDRLGGRCARKFPSPDRSWAPIGAGKARPASREPRKPKEKAAACRFPTSPEAPEGRGAWSGWGGAGRRTAPSQRRICFRFRAGRREDVGRCSLAATGNRRAAGGDARAGLRREEPGRRADYKSLPPSGAGFALPRRRVREQAEGLRQPTPATCAPLRPPRAPRGRGKWRAACVQLPRTPLRSRRRPFVCSKPGAPARRAFPQRWL